MHFRLSRVCAFDASHGFPESARSGRLPRRMARRWADGREFTRAGARGLQKVGAAIIIICSIFSMRAGLISFFYPDQLKARPEIRFSGPTRPALQWTPRAVKRAGVVTGAPQRRGGFYRLACLLTCGQTQTCTRSATGLQDVGIQLLKIFVNKYNFWFRSKSLYSKSSTNHFMEDSNIIFNEYAPRSNIIITELSKLVLGMLREVNLDISKDHFGLMAASFAYKQLEHLKSIHILVHAGQHRDAIAISRIMMEGFTILNWAHEEPIGRPLNWIKYSAVERYRLLYGTEVYSRQRIKIESDLKLYGNQFLKEESKTKTIAEITPDDYITNWRIIFNDKKYTKKSIINCFNETGYR